MISLLLFFFVNDKFRQMIELPVAGRSATRLGEHRRRPTATQTSWVCFPSQPSNATQNARAKPPGDRARGAPEPHPRWQTTSRGGKREGNTAGSTPCRLRLTAARSRNYKCSTLTHPCPRSAKCKQHLNSNSLEAVVAAVALPLQRRLHDGEC